MRIANLLRSGTDKLKLTRKTAGAPPGTLVFTGRQQVEEVTVHHIDYNTDYCGAVAGAGKIPAERSGQGAVQWIDVRGLHRTDIVSELGREFSIHPLVLEDIVDVHQRPKFEAYEEGISIVVKAFDFKPETRQLSIEQVSIYLTDTAVLSFQEDSTDLFAAVRQRIETKSGRIRSRGADYLAYALIDNIVDNYFTVIDKIESALDEVEQSIMTNPDRTIKTRIHDFRLALLTLRKNLSPLREVMRSFGDYDDKLITADTQLFVRDLRDHAVQVADLVETYRDINNGLYDLYVSEISLRMNQIMQTLTVVSTIFIPLSFLVGVYGMNWEYMPELGHRSGYFILWGVMLSLIFGMLMWFHRRGWV